MLDCIVLGVHARLYCVSVMNVRGVGCMSSNESLG